jgi:hypothetical protein
MVIPRDVVCLIVRFAFARMNLLYDRKFIAEIDIFTTSRCNFCNVKPGSTVDLRDLKTFLHLAESRHFGRSARAMHVSPSTLSRQIQRLEEDLGQPLFVRDNRTVTSPKRGRAAPLPSRRCCSISSFATPSISRAVALRRAAYLLLRDRRLQPSAADPRPLPRRASLGGN